MKTKPWNMYPRTADILNLAIAAVLILTLLAPAMAAEPSWSYHFISDAALSGIQSDISGDYVIYSTATGDPMPSVIQLYSISTGQQTRLAESDKESTVGGENIDGNYAVWFSEPQPDATGNVPDRIYLYTIDTRNLSVFRTSPSAAWPVVSGTEVVWSESEDGSMQNYSVRLYDITTGTTKTLPGVMIIGGSQVGFNGNEVLYNDLVTGNLVLYSPASGRRTTVYPPPPATTGEGAARFFALGGDDVIYQENGFVGSPLRGSRLWLYTISTGKTTRLSPTTGAAIEAQSEADMKAGFGDYSADATHVTWTVLDPDGNQHIIILEPATMAVSSISPVLSPDTSISGQSIDGDMMTFLAESMTGPSGIYLATESGGPGGPSATTPAGIPGPGPGLAAAGLIAGLFLARKRG